MHGITANGICIDCPDPLALAKFYAGLLGVEPRDDYVVPSSGVINLWFQPVTGYQAPTWPTQKRGQQLHLDFGSNDVAAAVDLAISLGATLTAPRVGYHAPILLDPVGHPFCLIKADDPGVMLAALNFDCTDHISLATFYQHMLGGEIDHFPEWANLYREGEITLSFQHAERYQPPTWPTQERGQQMHIDFHSARRPNAVVHAQRGGATLIEDHTSFSVLRDPAGHPFCICDLD